MKNLFLASACIIFCFLISCKESTSVGSLSNPQAETDKANTLKVYKAIETGDMSGLDSIIDKDAVDHSGDNGDIKGLDSIKKAFVKMHAQIKDLKIESMANATDGDYNFDLNRVTGTTSDASMGMPANTKIDMMSVDVVKIKDGKAVEHWGYADPKDIMKMMQGMKMDSTKMNH